MEAHSSRAGAGALSRAAPVPHRPARRRDDRLLPVAHRGRQPPAGQRHHRLPPALVRRPGRRMRRPRRHRPAAARGHQAPGRAHRDQRNRPAAHAPRARRRRAPARPRDPRLPALRRPARAARPCPRPHPRSPAGLPAAPDLARPRHPDRPHRRPGHHRRQPERVQARPRARHHHACARRGHRPRKGSRRRPPGDAPPRSPCSARAWIPGTRTRPRQRPTPRPSRWPPLSSAHHTPGRNNWQNPARSS